MGRKVLFIHTTPNTQKQSYISLASVILLDCLSVPLILDIVCLCPSPKKDNNVSLMLGWLSYEWWNVIISYFLCGRDCSKCCFYVLSYSTIPTLIENSSICIKFQSKAASQSSAWLGSDLWLSLVSSLPLDQLLNLSKPLWFPHLYSWGKMVPNSGYCEDLKRICIKDLVSCRL